MYEPSIRIRSDDHGIERLVYVGPISIVREGCGVLIETIGERLRMGYDPATAELRGNPLALLDKYADDRDLYIRMLEPTATGFFGELYEEKERASRMEPVDVAGIADPAVPLGPRRIGETSVTRRRR